MRDGLVRVEVTGAKEMLELFKQLPDALGQRVLRTALSKAAQPLLRELKSQTPIARHGSGSNRTGGELYRSMKARFRRTESPEVQRLLIGTPLHYAWFVEKGTEFQEPNPFMSRSFYATIDQCSDIFIEECAKSLDKTLSDYQRKRGVK